MGDSLYPEDPVWKEAVIRNIEKCNKQFDKIDADRNGYITLDEMKAYVLTLVDGNEEIANAVAPSLMLDANGDGVMDRCEMLFMGAALAKKQLEEGKDPATIGLDD